MISHCGRIDCKLLLKITKEPVRLKTDLIIGWAVMGLRKLSQLTLMKV